MAEMRVIGQQTEVLSRVREWMGPDEELALLRFRQNTSEMLGRGNKLSKQVLTVA